MKNQNDLIVWRVMSVLFTNSAKINADWVEENDGHLVFRMKSGSTVAIFAPGQWVMVEKQKNEGEIPV